MSKAVSWHGTTPRRAEQARPQQRVTQEPTDPANDRQQNADDVLTSTRLSVSIGNDYPSRELTLGEALSVVEQLIAQGEQQRARTALDCVLSMAAGQVQARYLNGLLCVREANYSQAREEFERVRSLRPDWLDNCYNLGHVCRQLGDHAAAIDALNQTLQLATSQGPSDHSLLARIHNGLASALLQDGQADTARTHYVEACALDDTVADYHANLAATELKLGLSGAALKTATRLTDRWADHAAGWKCLGVASLQLFRIDEAIAQLKRALSIDDSDSESWYQLGVALDEAGQWDNALDAQSRALSLRQDYGAALSDCIFLKRRLCDWGGLSALDTRFGDAIDQGLDGLKPFTLLSASDDPVLQRECAALWARQCIREITPLPPVSPTTVGPWRIGYLSSGFHNHPTACLTVEFFECHDRDQFRVHAYSVGPDDESELRNRVVAACDEFTDCREFSVSRLAGKIRDDRIDILVDLRGYGGGAVTGVLAMRPAPIQVNWLAYPGTMAAPFIDVILADSTVIPEGSEEAFGERVVRLPHRFQPNDTRRELRTNGPSRTELGLPEDAMVYCSFNNSYKFTPELMDDWMHILDSVPGSVLWLLDGKARTSTSDNLRAEAQRRGIDPARLVFLSRRPHLDYLACYQQADLFLDTRPYNAHTTASDSLWAGCPLLTLPGRSFASRVAASLVTAAGLADELVADSVDDYRLRAIHLGQDDSARVALRSRLEQARGSSPLFDTPGFCAQVAAVYRQLLEQNPVSSSRH